MIGKLSTRQEVITVTFASWELNDGDQRGVRGWQDALGITFPDIPLGTARLGYNAVDHEMHEPGQWWASFHVPASSRLDLTEAIDGAQFTNAGLELSLKDLYSRTTQVADAPGDACVFLRPDSVNARDLREVASGYMAFDLTGIGPVRREGELSGEDATSSGRNGLEEPGAVHELDEKPGRLAVRVKWLAAVVVVLAIAFALARH